MMPQEEVIRDKPIEAQHIFDPDELLTFEQHLLARTRLKNHIKRLTVDAKTHDEAIRALMLDHDATNVTYHQFAPKLVPVTRSTLSEKKLVENGVTADVIAASRVEKRSLMFRVDSVRPEDVEEFSG